MPRSSGGAKGAVAAPRSCAVATAPLDASAHPGDVSRLPAIWASRSAPVIRTTPMSAQQFVVQGGHKLSGRIRPSGNKNAALPIVAASLLCEEPVHLENVPRIRDVETLVQLLQSDRRAGRVDGAQRAHHSREVAQRDRARSRRSAGRSARRSCSPARSSPAAARSSCPPPGGDVIGRRRVDTHFLALQQLGATFSFDDAFILRAKRLRGADVFLDEPSVTATENALAAAVAAEGTTVLRNAASEPHVQDLAASSSRWARASRASARTRSPSTAAVRSTAARTRSAPITSRSARSSGSPRSRAPRSPSSGRRRASALHAHGLRAARRRLSRRGRRPRRSPAKQEMVIRSDLGGAVPKLEDQPWPAFPADTMSIALVTATQCEGVIVIHEKMFESRLFFVDKLIGMGARIVLCDPHRAVVVGPTQAAQRPRRVARHSRRHGDAARGALRRRGEHHRQRRTDRARLRAHRRAPPRARRQGRARRGSSLEVSAVVEPAAILAGAEVVESLPRLRRSRRSRPVAPPEASARSPTSRCATSWRDGARSATLLGGHAARLATAAQVHGTRRPRCTRGGWRGWLRGDDADGHLSRRARDGDGRHRRRLRARLHRAPVRRRGGRSLRLARHGGADHRASPSPSFAALGLRADELRAALRAGDLRPMLRGECRRRTRELTGQRPRSSRRTSIFARSSPSTRARSACARSPSARSARGATTIASSRTAQVMPDVSSA